MSDTGLLLGIDAGTTAVKVACFDLRMELVAHARREVQTRHPGPGRVEQDPLEILEAVTDAVAQVLGEAAGAPVLAAGLAHQGESVLAWEAPTGRPLTPVISWQDKRQEELLARIDPAAVARSGLPLDPYFSSGKLAWMLECDPIVSLAAELPGSLRLGTLDAFLTDRLGGRFATDLSTASRTQLLALGGEDWDRQLLGVFGVEPGWLPRLGPSFGRLGELSSPRWERALPLCAQLVDQQAALAGSGAVLAGQVKATYGTGVFVLGRTDGPSAAAGLLPTVAWAEAGADGRPADVAYALDGGVFAAGALLDWLATGLGLAPDAAALARMAATVPESAGVRLLPALAGLGAPWWVAGAHGVLAGLHGGVRPAHVARAALEGIAWRVADIVAAMRQVVPVESLRVDGGLSADQTLLQIQADALGLPVHAAGADMTVRGAALLAGVGAGLLGGLAESAHLGLQAGRTIEPRLDEQERLRRHESWRAFVAQGAQLE